MAAAFGFVHVVRSHQHGYALRRKFVQQVPQLSTSHRVDARSRFIEKQTRRVDE